jgi:CRP-like cAMP-binding protein
MWIRRRPCPFSAAFIPPERMSGKSRVVSSNNLLSALPKNDRERLLADCVSVELPLGEVLFDEGDRLRYVYFPESCFISMLVTIDDNSVMEVGMVGSEGMCGYELSVGFTDAPLRALVQGAGIAWRMDSASFLRILDETLSLRPILNRYIGVLLRQLSQTAACTRFHKVEERLARWLLMTSDRAASNSFPVTQEFLAFMLGVRRAGVTMAAGALQARNLIRYNRGKLSILDRSSLESAACTCYRADLRAYANGFAR